MSDDINLTACDREPIHIPGAIQPHGVLLVVDAESLIISHAAGDSEGRLGVAPATDTSLEGLLDADALAGLRRVVAGEISGFVGQCRSRDGQRLDILAHRSAAHLVVEFEPAAEILVAPAAVLGDLEASISAFARTQSLEQLCAEAAREFRRLTGYDRVMVYRFLEDGAGVVVAEDLRAGMHAFLHHHFPASDIPKQARALYIRNLVRVIPDVGYTPAPLRPAWTEDAPLDLSDSGLRSVSPVHLLYMKNMGVGASASVSIVKDGELWGLIACHNEAPRGIGYETRAACRTLAGNLARQIKAREETEVYRARIRLRSYEDDIVALLSREGTLQHSLSNHIDEVRRMLDADGVAILRGHDVITSGRCPDRSDLGPLAEFVRGQGEGVFSTHYLPKVHPPADKVRAVASGLLGMVLPVDEPWMVLWFRAERVEVINWAGNPHKDADLAPGDMLSPRASFAAWSETVHGRSRPWTLAETEAAGRLRAAVSSIWQSRQMRALNERLLGTIREKDLLLQQKQFLIGEVNHRVQNSLQLVSSFLSMQARQSEDPKLQAAIEEARRRLSAVSLVHRRLYRADQFETVDAARYVEDLLGEQVDSMGEDWRGFVTSNLAPVIMSPDRAVSLGLILSELVTNANKYAYGGAAGPLHVALSEDRSSFRLTVSDRGGGRSSSRVGFGSRMISALVNQLAGELAYENTTPGLEVTLTVPANPYPSGTAGTA
ncbi:histidine kinase dimerization/phosphoacceptor domain -containing protein [Terrihabitans sp. B22-R8]|uniref:histidine kinase dimerization/phosphoacceptor domain -containing protein n=1 Tax=Terrihabitans sp. B22-R8 TaxID=3425128 RepID=UPI00403C6455